MRRISVLILMGVFFCSAATVFAAGRTEVVDDAFSFKVYTDREGALERTATNKFFELLEEKVDYDITTQSFLRGELFHSEEHIEALRGGLVDVAVVSPSWAYGVDPIFSLFELPFLFNDIAHFHDYVVEQEGGALLEELLLEKANVRVLTWYSTGTRWMFLNERITALDDLQGYAMRSPGARIYLDMMNVMGMNPTTVAWAEVFTALETGMVEGVEAPPASAYDQRFHEVTSYALPTNHMLGVSYLVIREATFEGLPANLQDAMYEAAYETAVFMRDETVKLTEQAFRKMQEETGMQLISDLDTSPLRELFVDYHMEWARENEVEDQMAEILGY